MASNGKQVHEGGNARASKHRLASQSKFVAILLIEEAAPAIVATLQNVQLYTIDVDARTLRYGSSLAEIGPGPFPSQI